MNIIIMNTSTIFNCLCSLIMMMYGTLVLLVASLTGEAFGAIYKDIIKPPGDKDSGLYSLPNLPYEYTELEPYVDEQTIRIHHLGHHRSYTDKLNAALVEWRRNFPDSKLARSSIVDILRDVSSVPEKWRTAIKNNGGGYVNHILYWATMCNNNNNNNNKPSDVLKSMIKTSFGSFEEFKEEFTLQASKLFGSGYVWLCLSDEWNSLSIKTTINQESPITEDYYPILVIDVWEHSYYLKHQNKRPNYINDWWSVVCWNEVDQLIDFWLINYNMQGGTEPKKNEL